MGKLVTKIKSSKVVNSGVIKKVKDKIYYKFINPKEEKRTDKYREEIFNKFNIIFKGSKYVLMSGALLRYHRDNTMDGQDLDFFVVRDDFNKKIKDNFIKEGFKIKQVFLDKNNGLHELRFDYKGCLVDVFLVDKDKKRYHHYFTMENKNSKDVTKKVDGNVQIISGKDIINYERDLHYMDKVKDYEYKSTTFMGPVEIENAIYDIYGKNWTFYDPTYDPRYCPENNMPVEHPNGKSLVFVKPLESFEELEKIVKELK